MFWAFFSFCLVDKKKEEQEEDRIAIEERIALPLLRLCSAGE